MTFGAKQGLNGGKPKQVYDTKLTHAYNRYAEIVNVRLGDGSLRKGQVLEIAGKRAVVQVTLPSPANLYRVDLRRYLRHR